ncbi:MAG: glycosyltransferase [Actinomycetota bacterium]|nr:glycosyltransferase [Actinomycetota bacterium]
MSRPTLSVCLTTRNAADRLEWWFERVRPFADEIVVAVDAGSTDDTYDVAARHADVLTCVELPGFVEPSRDWLVHQARGDWVLILDDDEALPCSAEELLRPLLEDRRYTSCALPVRWVVQGPDGQLAWLQCHPWHSTHWLRLWRNIPGLYFVPGAIHSTPLVLGDSRALPADGPLALYHLNPLWSPRSEREAKVERYRQVAGPEDPTAGEYYLHEDYTSTLELAPLPTGETFPSGFASRASLPASAAAPAVTSYAQLRDHLHKRASVSGAVI